MTEQRGQPAPEALEEAVDVLHTLTSFETFDALAGPSRTPEQVAHIVQGLARAALAAPC